MSEGVEIKTKRSKAAAMTTADLMVEKVWIHLVEVSVEVDGFVVKHKQSGLQYL